MKSIFWALALSTLISRAWGILSVKVEHEGKTFYVFDRHFYKSDKANLSSIMQLKRTIRGKDHNELELMNLTDHNIRMKSAYLEPSFLYPKTTGHIPFHWSAPNIVATIDPIVRLEQELYNTIVEKALEIQKAEENPSEGAS
ncbi:hypothetical protein PGT21_012242 [Puccinia graminis f. sp. tritici]|uniref:Uncharacterized protein n=1 Tax=Puccinia graminis f. sp. tritici TaxID=56615 RepID=A0A5B0RU29_PUCGR|nr:hypothetical protein PGT21_012242 [Puccinia graminis f. sp. tritici]KAA1129536.1 hypothetical protein PGTUg99_026930 [Puccinia graminis f. sp. tritici]